MMAPTSATPALLLALLAVPLLLAGGARAQDEEPPADDGIDWSQFESIEDDDEGEIEDSGPFGAGFVDLLSELYDDPTLGGKISLYYTAVYRGRFHEFGEFDFPFPNEVTPDDLTRAED